MTVFLVSLKQMSILLIYALCGYFLRKTNLIEKQSLSGLSSVVLNIAMPAMGLSMFTNGIFEGNGTNLLYFSILYIAIVIISWLLGYGYAWFNKMPYDNYGLILFAFIFTNSGFMGLPVISAMYEEEELLYTTMQCMVVGVMYLSLGVLLFSKYSENNKSKKIDYVHLLKSPAMIATFIGLIIALLKIELPDFVITCQNTCKGLATPLALIVIGGNVADSNILDILKQKELYKLSFIRLLVLPLITLGLCKLLNTSLAIARALVMIEAMPFPTIMAVIAKQEGGDAKTSSNLIILSSVLSMITLPILSVIIESVI